ncbi:uncharacterized protein VP01_738g3 [Puccinia sorghi]|uniref:Cytochrome b-c1 complex subunit 2, mitochondrial n=1 Tax=Puccinia sorghi TaxID=27349 RepID=A0A0L6UCK3_9BASI|nr:uncharacterized protein VP01_738g3 [Puccinia sorghi]
MLLSLPSRNIARSGAGAVRAYAHQAGSATITTTNSNSAQTIISTPEDNKLTASISLFIKAGSRYQPSHGLAHLLKNSLFKSTQKRSALSVVRETELLGGLLTSTLTREHLILSAEFLKGNEGYFAEVLGDVLTSTKFARHEYEEEALPGAIAEYSQMQQDPTQVALEQAHQLAFREGLGNSLYVHPDLLPASQEAVIEYGRTKLGQTGEQAIVGTGIDGTRLAELVGQFFSVPSGSAPAGGRTGEAQTSYYGGEARITSAHGPDTLLVAFKGVGEGSSRAAYTVLQHLLGSDPSSVKWSSGGSTPLSSLPVKAFHLSYSDIGLFGLLVKAPASQTKSLASQALNHLKQIANGKNVDQDAVNRAANKAKFLLACGLESNLLRNELLGTKSRISPNSSPQQLSELYSVYSQVTPDQVIQAAKDILASTPSTVAVGNTQLLPYFDQLTL